MREDSSRQECGEVLERGRYGETHAGRSGAAHPAEQALDATFHGLCRVALGHEHAVVENVLAAVYTLLAAEESNLLPQAVVFHHVSVRLDARHEEPLAVREEDRQPVEEQRERGASAVPVAGYVGAELELRVSDLKRSMFAHG